MLWATVKAVMVSMSCRGAADDDQEPQHEQQVIDAEQDVVKAEHQVLAGRQGPGALATQHRLRLGGPHHLRRLGAVQPRHPHEDVGDGLLQTRKGDDAAIQRLGRDPDHLAMQLAARQTLHRRLGDGLPCRRQLQPRRVRLAVVDRRPPDDLPGLLGRIGGQLAQLQQAGLRFMGDRRGQTGTETETDQQQHTGQPEDEWAPGHAHRISATESGRALEVSVCGLSAGSTVIS